MRLFQKQNVSPPNEDGHLVPPRTRLPLVLRAGIIAQTMSSKQDRASCWSVTINNPTQTDEYNIQSARQKGWKVEGQLEKGSEGTPHYQLIVKTPQMRFSALKKQFPRAHIEIARNVQALENYVKKDETRVGELSEQSEMYPSLAKLWDLFQEWHDKRLPEIYRGNEEDAPQVKDENKRLHLFDQFIAGAIVRGYHVETMGVNPQIRSCVKHYMYQLLHRSRNIRRQTDRQTDEMIVSIETINGDSEEACSSSSSSSCSP